MYKLKAGLTWCLAAKEDVLLLLQTAQQIYEGCLFLLIPCLLCYCQFLLVSDYSLLDIAYVLLDWIQLAVHGPEQQSCLVSVQPRSGT